MIFLLPLQRTGHYFMSRVTYDQIMSSQDDKAKFLVSMFELEALIKESSDIVHITCQVAVPEEGDSKNPSTEH